MSEPAAPCAPLLVFGWGNPSRGDDALGPALVELLADHPAVLAGRVELLADFLLQVEHALDLQGRRAVLLVDADVAPEGGARGVRLEPVEPARDVRHTSHALSPSLLLYTVRQLGAVVPPTWLLAIPAQSCELGAPLGATARVHLQTAKALAAQWLAGHGA